MTPSTYKIAEIWHDRAGVIGVCDGYVCCMWLDRRQIRGFGLTITDAVTDAIVKLQSMPRCSPAPAVPLSQPEKLDA
jgi:hypothetical protein